MNIFFTNKLECKNRKNKICIARIILFFFYLLIFIPVNSQTGKVSLKLKEASLEDFFQAIEKQSVYRFSYRNVEIQNKGNVNITSNNIELKDVLNKILKEKGLTYQVIENKIIISIANVEINSNKTSKITGQVLDTTGMPIIGATIKEIGTSNGSITDFDGNFNLSTNEKAQIEVSYVGYKTLRLYATSDKKMIITLKEDTEILEDVVVIGYGARKKANVTGSITAVEGSDIKGIPTPNVSKSLAGKLAGVVVMDRSGEPGNDDAEISIRGFDSPLIIVDGVEASFNRIDPNDIESISVLKDASAAIYGARAGNGVILVTTKRGQISKPKVELNMSYSLQGATMYPKYVNAAQYMELVNDYNPGSYSKEEIEEYANGSKKSTDWYDATFRNFAPMWKSNINIRGGAESVKYFVSYGYMDQESIMKSNDTKYRQHNLRSNINVEIIKGLDLQLDIAYRNEHKEYPNASLQEIMTNLSFSRPTFTAVYPDSSKPSNNGYSLIGPNYLSQREVVGYRDSDYQNLSINAALTYNIPYVKGLTAKAFLNYTQDDNRDKNWKKDYMFYNYDPETDIYTENIGVTTDQISLNEYFWRNHKMTSQFSISYKNNFGSHGVEGLLLSEIIDMGGFNNQAGRQGFTNSYVDQIFASSADKQFTNGSAWQDARVSFVGRFDYNFKEKYLIEFTFRNDASPRFHKDYRWGFFPSISTAWRISEEEFIKKYNFIDNLKLRLSYGQTGYDAYDDMYFNYLTGYRYGANQIIDGKAVPTIQTTGLSNKYATWETMTLYNIGLDISLWNRKLWGEFDVFYRKRDGMLAVRSESLPSTFGAELPFENLNSQSNRGFEAVIGHDGNIGKDFKYWISGNISYSRAKWDYYDEPMYVDEDTKRRYQMTGQWVNRVFGLQALGLFTSEEEIEAYWVDQDGDISNGMNHNIKPGDIKYKDINGDNLINELDVHAIGKSNQPEYFFGLNAGFKYKGFDFSMLWQGAAGFNVTFQSEAQQPFYNNVTPLEMFMDRWTKDNNDKYAKFPRTVGSDGNSNNYRMSTFWLQDATYIRLKNISLGYTIPTSITSRIGIQDFRIYLSGQNLLTFSQVYPYDPETPDGGRGWNYPQQRTFMLGAALSF